MILLLRKVHQRHVEHAMPIEQRIFVIMPFSDEFEDVYAMIADSVREISQRHSLQLIPLRADEIAEPGRITDQVLRAIDESPFLIADMTDNNPNVMYELGYAHALEKPTII